MSRFRSQDDGSGKGHFSTITEGEKAQEVFTSHLYNVNFSKERGAKKRDEENILRPTSSMYTLCWNIEKEKSPLNPQKASKLL